MVFYYIHEGTYIEKRRVLLYIYTVAGAPKQRGTSEVSVDVRERGRGRDNLFFLPFSE